MNTYKWWSPLEPENTQTAEASNIEEVLHKIGWLEMGNIGYQDEYYFEICLELPDRSARLYQFNAEMQPKIQFYEIEPGEK